MRQYEGKKAALHTLGCKVNAYETDAMRAMLEDAGFEIVPFTDQADVYLINTCSVTNIADRKSRQMIHRARKMNPEAIVIAAGCYAQTASSITGLEIDADLILGNGRKKDLVREIGRVMQERGASADRFPDGMDDGERQTAAPGTQGAGAGQGTAPEMQAAGAEQTAVPARQVIRDVPGLFQDREYESLHLPRLEGRTRAYIKVQDGCNMFCTYCIIPYARGRVRSRSMEDILAEVRHLAQEGTKEVVLTGIHLSSYGVDFGWQVPEGEFTAHSWQQKSRLLDLAEAAASIDGIERIRLGSLEPTIITEENAERMSRIGKLCPHFHLSLQSGCDSVLSRMNRHYTAEEYREKVELLRAAFGDPALTTDVIAGFPGETEEEFRQTVDFLRSVRLYETHIFPYSRRTGTKAAAMPDQLTEARKAERVRILGEINAENRAAYIRRWIGRDVEVLMEERADGHAPNAAAGFSGGTGGAGSGENTADRPLTGSSLYAGYTREYIRVSCLSDRDVRGKIVRGRLRLENDALLV